MNQAKKGKNGSLTSVFQQTEFTLGIIIVALFIVASVGTDNFCTVYNITNLMKQCAIIGVLAVAQTMVIITGGIDISCGAITGLSCMVLALLQRDTNVNFYLTLVIAVVVSVLCGLINGIIVHEFRVPAMIATLGTQTIIYGIVKIISGALTVSGLDQRLLDMGNTNRVGRDLPRIEVYDLRKKLICNRKRCGSSETLRYQSAGNVLFGLRICGSVVRYCGHHAGSPCTERASDRRRGIRNERDRGSSYRRRIPDGRTRSGSRNDPRNHFDDIDQQCRRTVRTEHTCARDHKWRPDHFCGDDGYAQSKKERLTSLQIVATILKDDPCRNYGKKEECHEYL